jgi:hypothetical protein
MVATEALAERETALVFRLRVLVIFALLSAAIAVLAVVFKITSDGENDEFESQFAGSAGKILASFEDIVRQKIAAVGSLAVAATLHNAHNNVTWPFVTLDSFPERAAVAKSLSGAIFIGMYPVVFDENRDAWEVYAQDHFFEVCEEMFIYQSQVGISPFGEKETHSSKLGKISQLLITATKIPDSYKRRTEISKILTSALAWPITFTLLPQKGLTSMILVQDFLSQFGNRHPLPQASGST